MKLSAKIITLTFLGGFLGTFARYELTQIPEGFFYKFWCVNLIGAVVIAFLNHFAWFAKDERRAFFTVGITGGFTTMSGLSALVLYAWYEVLAQALVGVALYLATTAILKRVDRA